MELEKPRSTHPSSPLPGAARRTWLGWLSSTHRWLGVGLSIMFALWFATGAVLLFVPFPALAPAERLAHLPPIDLADIHVTPGEALAASASVSPSDMRMIQGPDAPVYVIGDADGHVVSVNAKDGHRVLDIGATGAAKLALAFSGRRANSVVGPFPYDQWVVHQKFDSLRPFYRVGLDGQDSAELYVSAHTGDIVQQTNAVQRRWNYVGAVVHWIYPTIIRKNFALWDNLVWCVALAGLCLAISGATLGLIRTSRSMGRPRQPAISPYRGLFRWHHIAGLGTGSFLLTWIFSGWLSMDHGRLFSTGTASPQLMEAYFGMTLGDAAAQVSVADMAKLAGAREILLARVDGRAFLAARTASAATNVIENLAAPLHPLLGGFPPGLILSGVRKAWPEPAVISSGPVAADDAYENLVTEPNADRLMRVKLADAASSWLDIDEADAHVKTVMDRSRRLYRWIYYGMHTFDLPFLSTHDDLRKAIILVLLAGGEGLSLTGLILGIRKLRQLESSSGILSLLGLHRSLSRSIQSHLQFGGDRK